MLSIRHMYSHSDKSIRDTKNIFKYVGKTHIQSGMVYGMPAKAVQKFANKLLKQSPKRVNTHGWKWIWISGNMDGPLPSFNRIKESAFIKTNCIQSTKYEYPNNSATKTRSSKYTNESTVLHVDLDVRI